MSTKDTRSEREEALFRENASLREENSMLRREKESLQERFEAAMAAIGAGSYEWDFATGRLEWTPHMFALLGLDPREAAASLETWKNALHPEDREAVSALLGEALEGRAPMPAEFRVIWPDGQVRWIAMPGNAAYVKDDEGTTLKMTGFCHDITGNRRTEEKLRRSMEETAAVLDMIPTPVWVAQDPECLVITGNRAANELTGLEPGGNISQSAVASGNAPYLRQLKPDGQEYKVDELTMQRAIALGTPVYDSEITFCLPDGRQLDYLGHATPLWDEDGRIRGGVAAFINITERKAMEAELEKHREHLEELVKERTRQLEESQQKLRETVAELGRSNKELEQFAYITSHDLQEPLRMVGSFAQLIEKSYRDKLDEEGEEYIGFIVDGVTRMQQMIEDILEFSRVATRANPYRETDMNNVLLRALGNLRGSLEQGGAVITHDPLPRVVVDDVQFTQVFQNLIGNALKFRGEEPPRIHISADRQGASWRFSARDNGLGIAPEHHERIFTLFQRLHSRKKFPGTGIGLSVCKKIVERHGGKIWVESAPGEGSTFYFTVPVNDVEKGSV